MSRDNLESWEIYEMSIVDVKNEKYLLVSPAGPAVPFINDDYMEDDISCYDDSKLFMRQRWLVDILPGPFEKTVTTHRYIEYYDSFYQEYIDGSSFRDFGSERKIQLSPNDEEGQIDDFNGIF